VFGWCIEKGEASCPQYITVVNGFLDWTFNHMKALRFSRREDAEMMVGIISDFDRIAEHGWE
jgi:hypothetical protein